MVARFVNYGGIVDGQLSSHKKSSHKVVFRKFESIPGVSNGRR